MKVQNKNILLPARPLKYEEFLIKLVANMLTKLYSTIPGHFYSVFVCVLYSLLGPDPPWL